MAEGELNFDTRSSTFKLVLPSFTICIKVGIPLWGSLLG